MGGRQLSNYHIVITDSYGNGTKSSTKVGEAG